MRIAQKFSRAGLVAGLAALMLASGCARQALDDVASSSAGRVAASVASASTRATLSDDAIIARIDALFVAEFKRFDISIAAEKGEVTLGGFALNKKQAERALEIARAVQGPRKVTDNISLYPLGYILQ